MQQLETMPTLTDKVVVITGGSSGIGHAAALDCARRGAKVLVTGRRPAPLDAVAALHSNIERLVADVAESEEAARTIAAATEKWGRLDVLVNNAGAGAILPLADATATAIASIFAANVVGPSLLTAAALPHLGAVKGVCAQDYFH